MPSCSRCGNPAGAGQAFCSGCGAAFAPAAPQAARSTGPVITGLIAGAVVLVAALIAGAVVLVQGGRDGDGETTADPQPAVATVTQPAATSSSPSAEPTSAGADRAVTRRTGPGDVMDLPAGLFCRDLMDRAYSYSASIDYWRGHGQPNQMDADRNGVPCETVYPSSDVAAYWGTSADSPDLVPELSDDVLSLPAGLLCRDVKARGFGYADAVNYWLSTGAPDAMDADLNGVPCETVYSVAEVSDYWTY